jgi:hypothetical protein
MKPVQLENVGEVDQPEPVGRSRVKHPVDMIERARRCPVLDFRPHVIAADDTLQANGSHQALDLQSAMRAQSRASASNRVVPRPTASSGQDALRRGRARSAAIGSALKIGSTPYAAR